MTYQRHCFYCGHRTRNGTQVCTHCQDLRQIENSLYRNTPVNDGGRGTGSHGHDAPAAERSVTE